MSRDGDEQPPHQTQRRVIEDAVGRVMASLSAVHTERSRGDGRVPDTRQRELQSAVLAVLDYFAPFRAEADMDWSEIGPDGWSPEQLREEVRTGEVGVVQTGEFDPGTEQARRATLIDTRVLEAVARDLLELASELGHYPNADTEPEPVVAEAI